MIKSNSQNIVAALDTLRGQVKDLTGKMLRIAQLINASIKQRSQKGIGLDGKMPGYTPAYKKWKKKKGRQVSTRDLTFSGKMWASLTEAITGGSNVRLFFGSKQEQAKAIGNTETAPFFGMTKQENAIYATFQKDVLKGIHF